MGNLLAQTLKIPGMSGAISGPLPSGKFKTLADLINNARVIIFPVAGILLLAYLIWGGFDFLTSMGDPKKAESGRNKITQAIVGFLIIFAAYWLTQLIVFLFGLNRGATPIS